MNFFCKLCRESNIKSFDKESFAAFEKGGEKIKNNVNLDKLLSKILAPF